MCICGGGGLTFLPVVTEGCGKDMSCLWLAFNSAARTDFCVYLHFSEHQSLCSHLSGHFVGKLSLAGMTWHFLSLPQIPSPLPISIAVDLSGLSFRQPELIQVPISEEQNDSNDAAVSQCVTWGTGAWGREKRGLRVGGQGLNFPAWYLESPVYSH